MADQNVPLDGAESKVIPFRFENAEVRTLRRGSEPWFVLADVCRVLEVGNSRDAAARLDDDEKGVDTIDTPGGDQEMTIINESGLYSLILTSRKPAAKRFKKWVTAEVLPAIRKTGAYNVTPPAAVAEPQVFTRGGCLLTSSRDVAAWFGRPHDQVLQAIDNVLASHRPKLLMGMFQETFIPDDQGRLMRGFDMDLNGFTLLTVSFNEPGDWARSRCYAAKFSMQEASVPRSLADSLGLVERAKAVMGERGAEAMWRALPLLPPLPLPAVQPEPLPAPAVAAVEPVTAAPNPLAAGIVQESDLVEHTTKLGKVIRGIVLADPAQARLLDSYTFPLAGGWFVRERRLVVKRSGATAVSGAAAAKPARPRGRPPKLNGAASRVREG